MWSTFRSRIEDEMNIGHEIRRKIFNLYSVITSLPLVAITGDSGYPHDHGSGLVSGVCYTYDHRGEWLRDQSERTTHAFGRQHIITVQAAA